MAEPIIYVDHSEIRPGKLAELRGAIRELAEHVEAGEPRLLSYAAFVDEDGRRLTVIHIHRDAASLELHARVAGPLFQRFVDLVRLISIDLYGSPSDEAVAGLRDKAAMLGGATLTVHPFAAGFVRDDPA